MIVKGPQRGIHRPSLHTFRLSPKPGQFSTIMFSPHTGGIMIKIILLIIITN